MILSGNINKNCCYEIDFIFHHWDVDHQHRLARQDGGRPCRYVFPLGGMEATV